MSNGEELLSYFQQEISKAANKELEVLNKKTEAIRQQSMERLQAQAKEDALIMQTKRINELEEIYAKKMSVLNSEINQKLISRRNDLQEEIFTECKKELVSLVQTEQYDAFMEKKLGQLESYDTNQKIVIQLTQKDLKFKELFLEKYPSAEIEVNNNIEIGGFILINYTKGIVYDETIDCALQEQKDWFINHSKLTIR